MWEWLASFFPEAPPQPEVVRTPPEEFACAEPPVWLVEWEGKLLPRGPSFQGRLPLWNQMDRPIAEIVYPLSRTRPVERRTVELSEAGAGRLWVVLIEEFPSRLLSHPPGGTDGFPFMVVVHRREPCLGIRARCDLLDGLTLLQKQPEGVALSITKWEETKGNGGQPIPAVLRLGLLLLDVSFPSFQ